MFETNRPTLILTRGIPGSGKSTLAALLGFMSGAPSISLALELASNKSRLYNTEREGVVYKCNEKQASFKVISNTYLLKQK